jgi:AraC family transcriptional regulator of adaptative response/methylated-DNA-[protein]-cysteine methyltransferase
MTNGDQHPHYELVARAIAALSGGADTSLAELSSRLGVSEFHLQRTFGEWAGVSPKRFMQFISKERALAALRSENDVLSATLSAGLSSPGRLHDLMVSCEGVTPGEARALATDVHQGKCILLEGYGDIEAPATLLTKTRNASGKIIEGKQQCHVGHVLPRLLCKSLVNERRF